MPPHTSILINTVRRGDATAEHTFELARTLADAGYGITVHHNFPAGSLPVDIVPLACETHPVEYQPAGPLTILEYPLWFPLAERFRDIPGTKIFWYHGVTEPTLWSEENGRDRLVNSRIRTELALHAHLAVATSPFTADELHRHSGLPRERIRIVPLGIPLEHFQQAWHHPQADSLRTRLQLRGHTVLLYVGRVGEHKRIDLLIDVVHRLTSELPNIRLLLVGDNSSTVETENLTADLRARAADLGVAERVTFVGRVDSVVPYYGLADLYVQASQHEGFGVPLVEAMAAGLPVVAAADGAMPWVLGDENDVDAGGLLCASGDAADMAAKVKLLLTNPSVRHRFAAGAEKRVQRFSLAMFRANALAAIDEAVARTAEGTPADALQADAAYQAAEISMHTYKVRSNLPLVGALLVWLRRNSTTHLKEAYLDRIVEQQVNYNRAVARELSQLRTELAELRRQLDPPDGMS